MNDKLKKLTNSIKFRWHLCLYTLKHKKAFLEVEKKFRGKNTINGYLHDIEKPLLYLFCFWINPQDIHKFHKQHNRHHVNNNLKKSYNDLVDTIIDWECARITKADKPLNAYETLIKYYPEHTSTYLPIIKQHLPHQIIENQHQKN